MKVLSLFSGVGGFDMGLENAGMQTVFQCEWDKHANSILHKHWPQVPKWEDVSTLTGKHILTHAPVIDVVAWGSPCQDLSVAGKRGGLEGERSGLFHEGIRIIKELRKETNGQYPRISIWENVVGALNSNRGADFGIILDEMAEAGAMVIEWAVLDAQYFGVPQRRRRVFVIAIFDPAIAERCPNPLLPVAESLPRYLAKIRETRQKFAESTSTSIECDSEQIWIDRAAWNQGINAKYAGEISNRPCVPPLTFGVPHAVLTQKDPMLIDGTRVDDVRVYESPVQTLKERMGTGGNNVPQILESTMAVRRLTPLECERLMGWPDDHTRYKADGTEQADTHRYKQCGNGVASPVAQWIGKHLLKLEEQQ